MKRLQGTTQHTTQHATRDYLVGRKFPQGISAIMTPMAEMGSRPFPPYLNGKG